MIQYWEKISKIAATSVVILALVGCASSGNQTLKIVSEPLERAPLALSAPEPVKLSNITWRIITPENANAVWSEMQLGNQELALVALTIQGYQQLILDLEALRAFIANQRFVILQYQEYYESPQPPKNNKK